MQILLSRKEFKFNRLFTATVSLVFVAPAVSVTRVIQSVFCPAEQNNGCSVLPDSCLSCTNILCIFLDC